MTKREYAKHCYDLSEKIMEQIDVIAELQEENRELRKQLSITTDESVKNTRIILKLCNDWYNRQRLINGDFVI